MIPEGRLTLGHQGEARPDGNGRRHEDEAGDIGRADRTGSVERVRVLQEEEGRSGKAGGRGNGRRARTDQSARLPRGRPGDSPAV